MAEHLDPDERVQIALVAENSGNQHQRRMVVVDRALDALLRSALGETDEVGQVS
jgi:hypothetical protein